MKEFSAETELKKLTKFIQKYVSDNQIDGVVIGISGGKDSTIASAIFAHILGPVNVIGITIPCHSIDNDTNDAKKVAKLLGFKLYEINITNAYEELTNVIDLELDINSKAVLKDAQINIKPRLRMSTLYYVAQALSKKNNKRYIVAGTGNKCEIYVGYFTKFGDGASDINILANYTVSEVLKLGDYLRLPKELVYKTPSDGLSGISDEEKMGVTYAQIEKHINREKFNQIVDKMHKNSEHKRKEIVTNC